MVAAESTAVGLPEWVNHLAFGADGPEDLAKKKQRWLDCGYSVLEIDHHWCHSIYTKDPDGTMVEFCITTAEFSAEDRETAKHALESDDLEFGDEPIISVHKTTAEPVHEQAD